MKLYGSLYSFAWYIFASPSGGDPYHMIEFIGPNYRLTIPSAPISTTPQLAYHKLVMEVGFTLTCVFNYQLLFFLRIVFCVTLVHIQPSLKIDESQLTILLSELMCKTPLSSTINSTSDWSYNDLNWRKQLCMHKYCLYCLVHPYT